MPWVTVARFADPPAAHVIRALLEANGIDAYLRNEFYVGMDWLHSQAVGGVKLQVSTEQADQAVAIIATPPSLPEPQAGPDEVCDAMSCPGCDGQAVEPDGLDRRIRAASLGLGIPAAIGSYRYVCRECGHRWRRVPPHRGLRARLRNLGAVTAGFLLTLLLTPFWILVGLFGASEATRLECWACGVPFEVGELRCGGCDVPHPPALAFERVIQVGRPYDGICPSCHTPYVQSDYTGSPSRWRCSICRGLLLPHREDRDRPVAS